MSVFKHHHLQKWWLIDSRVMAEGSDFYIDLESGSLNKAGIQLKIAANKNHLKNSVIFDVCT